MLEQRHFDDLTAMRWRGGHVMVSWDGDVSLNIAPCYRHNKGRQTVSGFSRSDGEELVKRAIEAGVLVLDMRTARSFKELCSLVVSGPMLAQGDEDIDPPPYGALSYAPLHDWIKPYLTIGVTVHNYPKGN